MPDNPMPKSTVASKTTSTWHSLIYWVRTHITSEVIAAFLAGVLVGLGLS